MNRSLNGLIYTGNTIMNRLRTVTFNESTHRIVPVKPTNEMLDALKYQPGYPMRHRYEKLLDAAPKFEHFK